MWLEIIKYSWEKLHYSVKFETSGNNITADHNKFHLGSFLVA